MSALKGKRQTCASKLHQAELGVVIGERLEMWKGDIYLAVIGHDTDLWDCRSWTMTPSGRRGGRAVSLCWSRARCRREGEPPLPCT